MPRRSRPIARGERITPKKRTPSEFARIYGSRARVQWVKAQPCIVCGWGPCDNAHTENGGMGRKADACSIVPLCCMPMHDDHSPGYVRGHHGVLHDEGAETFQAIYRVDLKAEAARIDTEWQAECARRASLTRKER